MGEVWLAWHRRTGGAAALKLLRDTPGLSGRGKRLFARESRAIARLAHPNIVSLYEVGADHLAMAYVDGPNLAQRLQTPVEPATAVHLALQMADALAHAHERGVVHRDVKPSNILLDTWGNAYLGDFGLALLAEDQDADLSELRAGTPGYMAPEQLEGRGVGPASDQYGLARTLLEMLSGGSVPVQPSLALEQLPGSLPGELRAVLGRALSRDPAARYPSVAQLAAALGRIELAGHAPPMRIAPEVRGRAPFAWCAAKAASVQVSPDIVRADYTIEALAESGLVSRELCRRFLAASGYAGFGWSMYAHTSRLGPISESALLARASDLVVIAHGTLCTRKSWGHVAAALCRNNAQAVVLVPDVLGFGESRFAERVPALEQLRPRALAETLLAWLELLGVRDLPTVLAAHSAAAVALLSVSDEELGERTARVAITPVFPSEDAGLRRSLWVAALLLTCIGWWKWLANKLAYLAFVHGPDARRYDRAEQLAMYENFCSVPGALIARLCRALALARPAPGDRLERCAICVGNDDPLAPEARVLAAIERLGLPARSVYRMASGGHNPYAEDAAFPGWTARNVDDIARVIDSMLVSSRDGTPLSTEVASTVLAGSDDAGSTEPELASGTC